MMSKFSLCFALACACCALPSLAQAEDFGALYRAHIDAFNRRDAKVFFARYAPSFCFHNDTITPADLTKTYTKHFEGSGDPIEVKYVHTLSESPTDARLWAVFMHGKRPVTRVLSLQKNKDGWTITAETNPARLKCAPDLLKDLPDDLAKVITSTTKQIQKLGDLLDAKTDVDSILWDDIYCPSGFSPEQDSWTDHEYGDDGEVEDYCRVGGAECRNTARETPPTTSTFISVSTNPECGPGNGPRFQNAGFTLTLKGSDAFSINVERPYP